MKTIAFDAFSSSSTTGGSPFQWSHTCTGSDRVLLVALHNAAGDTVSDVTYNGTTMTQIGKQNVFGGSEVYLYILIAPASGTNTISVTKSSGNMSGAAASYTGIKQTGQPDASTTNTGSGSSYSESLTSLSDNCWHISAVFAGASSAISAGANTTVRGNISSPSPSTAFGDTNAVITPAGSNTLNFSITGTPNWASIGVTLGSAPDIYTLTASTGTYTLTGNDAAMYRIYTLVAATGTYTLTGFAAALTRIQKWINATPNTTSFSNQSKNSTTWTNQSENSTSFTNQNRS